MPHYIEKLRVPVRLARAGAPVLDGVMFLLPLAEHHAGPETLLDRLNAPTRMFPLQVDGGEGVLLVARDQVAWVEPRPGVDGLLVRPASYMPTRREDVRVWLADGEAIDGVLEMEMPTEFNRASDHLNGEDDFFTLDLPGATRLLNKRHVREVHVRESVSLPKAA